MANVTLGGDCVAVVAIDTGGGDHTVGQYIYDFFTVQ